MVGVEKCGIVKKVEVINSDLILNAPPLHGFLYVFNSLIILVVVHKLFFGNILERYF